MTRFERLEHLLSASQAKTPNERRAFLEEQCGDDKHLLDEAWSMLQLNVRDEEIIGPYRVIKTIGRGGMGVVQLAERIKDYPQLVAIKRFHSDTGGDVVSRFFREREMLAKLEHPAIVRLLDGGTTPLGRPYLVMEYVAAGVHLDDYCRERQLPLRERLRLFHDVCNAVHYAHGRLVVHRDLKPSNILVQETENGHRQVKLVDFGLAKLLGPSAHPDASDATLAPPRFTRGYASPEQLFGDPPDVRLDVYALGAILFRLLTFLPVPSFPLAQAPLYSSREDWIRAIYETDPEPPSVALTRQGEPPAYPPEHAKDLDGDLDSIVIRAMQREPTGRYQSVQELADDVQRHLDVRPISARRSSFAYRSTRYLRRNKWRISIAGIVMLAVLVLLLQQRTVRIEAQKQAELERDLVQRSQEYAASQTKLTAEAIRQAALSKLARERAEEQTDLAENRLLGVRASEIPDRLQRSSTEGLRSAIEIAGDSLERFHHLTAPVLKSLKLAVDSSLERSRFPTDDIPGAVLVRPDNGSVVLANMEYRLIKVEVRDSTGKAIAEYNRSLPRVRNPPPISPGIQEYRRKHRNDLFPTALGFIHLGDDPDAVALDPGGTKLVAGDDYGRIVIWDFQHGTVQGPWQGHDGSVLAVGFSADGRLIATGGEDQIVRLWDLDGHPIGEPLRGHDAPIGSLAFSPNGKFVAAGSVNTVRIWTIKDGTEAAPPLKNDQDTIRMLKFSANGRMLGGVGNKTAWVLGWNFGHELWTAEDLEKPDTFFTALEGSARITSFAFHPNNLLAATGANDGTITLWDIFATHTRSLNASRLPDANFYSTLAKRHGLEYSNAGGISSSDKGGPQVLRGHDGLVSDVAFNPNGRTLASVGVNEAGIPPDVRLWDIQVDGVGKDLSESHRWSILALVDDGSQIATAGEVPSADSRTGIPQVRFWNWKNMALGKTINGHGDGFTALAIDSKRQLFVTGTDTGNISFWRAKDKVFDESNKIVAHRGAITGLAIRGEFLVSTGADNVVRIWTLRGTLQRQWSPDVTGTIERVAIDEETGLVVVISCTQECGASLVGDKRLGIRIYSWLGAPTGLAGSVSANDLSAMAISRDGTYAAFGDPIGIVWLFSTRQPGRLFVAHKTGVGALAFSPDGTLLASGGSDSEIRFWSLDGSEIGLPLQTLAPIGRPLDRFAAARTLVFSPQGDRLASLDSYGVLRVWRTDWLQMACDRLSAHPYFTSDIYAAESLRSKAICQQTAWLP